MSFVKKEQLDQVQEWLRENNPEGLSCPICSHPKVEIQLTPVGRNRSQMVVLTCNYCGHKFFFSAKLCGVTGA